MKVLFFFSILILFNQNILAYSLDESLISAYENNPKIKAEIENVQAFRQDKKIAGAEFLPTITGTFSGTKQASRASSSTRYNYALSREIGVSVNQSLFSGGSSMANFTKQDFLTEKAKLSFLITQQNVFLDVIKSYMELLEAEEILLLRLANQKALNEHFLAAKQKFELGESTKTDVETARARLMLAKSTVIEAEGNLLVKKEIFRKETYLEPEDLSEPLSLPVIPVSLDNFFDDAYENNLNIRAYKLQLNAAKQDIKINFGKLLPYVNLAASASHSDDLPSGSSNTKYDLDSRSVSLTLTVPFFKGGADYSNYQKSKNISRMIELNYKHEQNKLKEELVSAWHNHNMYISKLDANLTAVQAAEIALQGIKQEVEVGSRNILDLLDSETNLVETQLKFVQSKKDKILSSYNLLALKGNLVIKDLNLNLQEYIL